MLKIYNRLKGLSNFELEKAKRKLAVMGDYSFAHGFGFKELVFTNDAQAV